MIKLSNVHTGAPEEVWKAQQTSTFQTGQTGTEGTDDLKATKAPPPTIVMHWKPCKLSWTWLRVICGGHLWCDGMIRYLVFPQIR